MAADRLEKTRELLLQAVESLRDSTSSAPPPSPERNSAPPNASQASGCGERASVIGERNRLFNFGFLKKVGTGGGKSTSRGVKMPKSKKRLNSWNHDFVCLTSTMQSKPPTSFETGELMRGGLGKKQLTLFEHDGPSELHGEIMLAFPKLKEGGGYELLRIGGSGDRNTLQLIPQPAQGFSVFYLKEVVRQAKIFIRPLQRNIDILLDTTISPTFVRIILHVLVYAIRFESIKIVSFACESDIYI